MTENVSGFTVVALQMAVHLETHVCLAVTSSAVSADDRPVTISNKSINRMISEKEPSNFTGLDMSPFACVFVFFVCL